MNIKDYSLAILDANDLAHAIYDAAELVATRMVEEGIDPENLNKIHLQSVIDDLVGQLTARQSTNFAIYGLYKTTSTKK